MLVKTTIEEILKMVLSGNVKITNNSVCGKCSKCGECCTNLLKKKKKDTYTLKKQEEKK